MPRSARQKSRSGIYHVMLRGANRQEIFHDDYDCKKFLDLILRYKIEKEMEVFAWCLMNNHVHLLLKEGNESVSLTMKRIGVSYATYYNNKYMTTGHLFQDRFRSENVETIRYLLTVTRYIHQNPVKAGIVAKNEEWRWSSCAGYYGKMAYPKGLLDRHHILAMFSDKSFEAAEKFKEFNEIHNDDLCLDDNVGVRVKLSDEEARILIKQLLGVIEIAHVKSLPREKRNEMLRSVKQIKGLSQRQIARILGVSANLVFKA